MNFEFQPRTGHLTLAVTGASGSIFAATMLHLLGRDDRVRRVSLLVSDHALRVLAEEHRLPGGRSSIFQALQELAPAPIANHRKFDLLDNADVGAGIASGSFPSDGMIVLPCSMGTLASISHGLSNRLIERAADVTLKERRPLVLCVRETPFHLIHLRNMTAAAEAGATIFPLIPTFYNRPESVHEMATQFCCRVLAHLGLDQPGAYRWKAEEDRSANS